MLAGAVQERVVRFRTSTVLTVLGITIAVALLLQVVWIARQVLTWVLIAVFLALAMNPAVEWLQTHGLKRRAAATGVTFLFVLAGIVGIGALFVPTLDEVRWASSKRTTTSSTACGTRSKRAEPPRECSASRARRSRSRKVC
jgi:predicted PurR-regulated permease PerM